jgi:hypothetical protein
MNESGKEEDPVSVHNIAHIHDQIANEEREKNPPLDLPT